MMQPPKVCIFFENVGKCFENNYKNTCGISDNTVVSLNTPQDPLTELIRQGARDLIAQAIEAELQQLLAQHQSVMVDGKQS